MASSANISSRRGFLAAAALAPVAISLPAMAAPAPRVADLIAEYWAIMDEHERHPFGRTMGDHPDYKRFEQEADAIHERALAVQQRALRLPAKSRREVGMKLDMILKDYRDCQLPDDLLQIIADDARRMA